MPARPGGEESDPDGRGLARAEAVLDTPAASRGGRAPLVSTGRMCAGTQSH